MNVSYKLAYALPKGGETFEGKVEIKFDINEKYSWSENEEIFVDYRGEKIHSLVVNGTQITSGEPFHDHRIFIKRSNPDLKPVDNIVAVRFTSRYVRDCAGVQYFQDKEDKEEYLYSESEPFNQHKAFPCFDQPDLKGEITFMAVVPKTWIVRANSPALTDPVDIS